VSARSASQRRYTQQKHRQPFITSSDKNREELHLQQLGDFKGSRSAFPMPTYSSLGSPSLRKMEGLKRDNNRKKFSMGNIFGDPFALATISIAIVREDWTRASDMIG